MKPSKRLALAMEAFDKIDKLIENKEYREAEKEIEKTSWLIKDRHKAHSFDQATDIRLVNMATYPCKE